MRAQGLYFILFVFLLYSCKTELDLPQNFKEKQLVINGILFQDSVPKIEVVSSKVLGENPNSKSYIMDASVTLFSDNAPEETLHYEEFIEESRYENEDDKISYKYTGKKTNGNVFQLSVSAPNFTSVVCQTEMPSKCNFEIKDTTWEIQNDEMYGGYSFYGAMNVNILLEDNPDEKNYYFVTACGPTETTYIFDSLTGNVKHIKDYIFTELYIQSSDPIFSENTLNTDMDFGNMQYGFYFNDLNFNGLTKQFIFNLDCSILARAFMDEFEYPEFDIKFKIWKINEALYLYFKTLNIQEIAKMNPFSEPASVYSNSSNGFGILGAANVTERIIHVTPPKKSK